MTISNSSIWFSAGETFHTNDVEVIFLATTWTEAKNRVLHHQ